MIRKLLLAIGFIAVLAVPSNAQAVQGIALAPALQELTLSEGQAATGFTLEITNTTQAAMDISLSTVDFGALDESGGIAFLGRSGQETGSYGLKQWLILEKDRLTLEPGQSQDVQVSVENRESLGPGGHYGAVIVSGGSAGNTPTGSLAVLPAASTLVFLNKSGGELRELKLDSQKANSNLLKLPQSITLRFQNSGNTHVVPRGTVELYGPTGRRISRAVINEQSARILPESFRHFTLEMPGNNRPWLPGRYRMVTAWRMDGQETVTEQVAYYWYVGQLTIWLFVILCLVIVLYLYIQYRRRPPTRST